MSYSGWAIIELFGHQRVVGKISEVQQYGVTMARIEALVGPDEFKVQDVGGSAIFRITHSTEEEVRGDWSLEQKRAPRLPASVFGPSRARHEDDGDDWADDENAGPVSVEVDEDEPRGEEEGAGPTEEVDF